MAERDRTCDACDATSCSLKNRKGEETPEEFLERRAIGQRMCQIKHKVLVLSGKGGVGKSTVAANLAVALALARKRVGLLDIDVHGPSIPRLLGLEGRPIESTGEVLLPVQYNENLKVMSIGFMLESREDAVIWRGPMKFGLIKQFLRDVEWGPLDYLVVDSPPGTGDEPLSIAQLIPDADGAIMVTTPQDVAVADVRRCISFCRQINLRVLGVIENMSGMVCPHCNGMIEVFKSGGGKHLAREMGVPFLGSIPLDPAIVDASDAGTPYVDRFMKSEAARAFQRAIAPIQVMTLADTQPIAKSAPVITPGGSVRAETVRLAIPVAEGRLVGQFGETQEFALIDANRRSKAIVATERAVPPDSRQPGLFPQWLREQGIEVVIAGGVGSQLATMFKAVGIAVHVGEPGSEIDALVGRYFEGKLPWA